MDEAKRRKPSAIALAKRTVERYFDSRGRSSPHRRAHRVWRSIASGPGRLSSIQAKAIEEIIRDMSFDVDDLAENHLGIEIRYESLDGYDSRARAQVFGFAEPDSRSITICPRTLEYIPLYRTTVLHEIGHVLLHRDQSFYAPEATSRPDVEREADQFMSYAILPFDVLRVSLAFIAHLNKINLNEVFLSGNLERGRFQWHTRFLPALINNLCVSRQMILLAALRSGLIDQDSLNYHCSYAIENNRWLKRPAQPPLARPLRNIFKFL